jgi:hypothetical protein
VKNAAAARKRQLKLQTSYGRAMAWAKGFADEDARTAFSRAQALAGADNADERFSAYYELCLGSRCAAS